jgi:hypothetical protein
VWVLAWDGSATIRGRSSGLVGGYELIGVDEVIATGMWRQVFLGGAGILAATRRPDRIDGASAEAIRVVTQEGAGEREFAALSAAVAVASSILCDGQQRRCETLYFVSHGVEPDYAFDRELAGLYRCPAGPVFAALCPAGL